MRASSGPTMAAAVLAALAAALLVAGCTSDSSGGGPSGSGTGSASGSASVSAPAPASSTGGSASSQVPVATPSVVPTRSQVTKPPVALRSPASFGGGVSARLIRFESAKVTDRGPGALVGRAATAFTVEFTNRSSSAVSLATVEVSAMYGDKLAASPVNLNQNAASGSVARNSTGRGVYTFAIPTADLGDVQISVALDPRRPVVVFAGSVR